MRHWLPTEASAVGQDKLKTTAPELNPRALPAGEWSAGGLLNLPGTASRGWLLRCRPQHRAWQQKRVAGPQEMRMSAQPQNFSAG